MKRLPPVPFLEAVYNYTLGCFKGDTLSTKKIAMPVPSPPGHTLTILGVCDKLPKSEFQILTTTTVLHGQK